MQLPSYKELPVKKMWPNFKDDSLIKEYMPDLDEKELPEKEFFFGLLTTLYYQETQKLIESARGKRAITKKEDKEELIEIEPSILKEIKSLMDFKSKLLYEVILILLQHPEEELTSYWRRSDKANARERILKNMSLTCQLSSIQRDHSLQIKAQHRLFIDTSRKKQINRLKEIQTKKRRRIECNFN